METVEVVIRLPKEVYEKIQQIDRIISGRRSGKTIEFALWNGVKNGTVLPKGHGKLIDADAATKDINAFQDAFAMYTDNMGKYNIVCTAPTVIEADKEDDNGTDDDSRF